MYINPPAFGRGGGTHHSIAKSRRVLREEGKTIRLELREGGSGEKKESLRLELREGGSGEKKERLRLELRAGGSGQKKERL